MSVHGRRHKQIEKRCFCLFLLCIFKHISPDNVLEARVLEALEPVCDPVRV